MAGQGMEPNIGRRRQCVCPYITGTANRQKGEMVMVPTLNRLKLSRNSMLIFAIDGYWQSVWDDSIVIEASVYREDTREFQFKVSI